MSAKETRRRVLEFGVWGILGTIGAAVSAIVSGAALAPAFTRKKKPWIPVTSLEKLTSDPQRFDIEYDFRQGWLEEKRADLVYAYRDASGNPVALSPVCTHLGCTVRWDAKAKEFQCPCHGGVYDARGQVVSGPPERPLAKLEVQIEGDRLLMKRA